MRGPYSGSMGQKKNINKLLSEPTEMSIREVTNVLGFFGYKLDRIKGSHHIFAKPGYDTITVPAHRGKVAKVYLKDLKKLINHML